MGESAKNTTVPTGTHQFLSGNHSPTELRYVAKCYRPNYSVLNNLITAENVTIGIFQLYQLWGSILIPHTYPKGIGEMPTPLYLLSKTFAPSILSKPYFFGC